MKAAESSDRKAETLARIRKLVAGEVSGELFVTKILGAEIEKNV